MGPDEHAEFVEKLKSRTIRLPSQSTIYKARTKLDWICMLYQQRLWSRTISGTLRWSSQLAADASPQGYEYFNAVEDLGGNNRSTSQFMIWGLWIEFSKFEAWGVPGPGGGGGGGKNKNKEKRALLKKKKNPWFI